MSPQEARAAARGIGRPDPDARLPRPDPARGQTGVPATGHSRASRRWSPWTRRAALRCLTRGRRDTTRCHWDGWND